jgi:trimethylamine--corrinoid protein Co-methyltransferase
MVGSLMGCSYEAMVVDNDMLGSVMRTVRGIEVTEETLSYGIIEEVVHGDGHFLRQPQTLELMRSEYEYPEIGDRGTPSDWEGQGSPDARQRAAERAQALLSSYYPEHIDPAIDSKIRDQFPIVIAREDMQPGNGRW